MSLSVKHRRILANVGKNTGRDVRRASSYEGGLSLPPPRLLILFGPAEGCRGSAGTVITKG
jgi:hypothetical protein